MMTISNYTKLLLKYELYKKSQVLRLGFFYLESNNYTIKAPTNAKIA